MKARGIPVIFIGGDQLSRKVCEDLEGGCRTKDAFEGVRICRK